MSKIILDLCGGTGSWSAPYKEAGYEVYNITLPNFDIFEATIHSDGVFFLGHNVDDLFIKFEDIHGILAAPPCTHFSGSGAQFWKSKDQDGRTLEDLSIATACLMIIAKAQPKFWAIENPVGRLKNWFGNPKMYFNPCDYGDAYTKKTCLWGSFNEPEKNPVEPKYYTYANGTKRGSYFHVKLGGKSARTKELRSITPRGFAEAFYKANQ